MFAKGKGSAVPSDGQARGKLALYVYEYLRHVGAQKSAQTFLSEIRWERNITLGEPVLRGHSPGRTRSLHLTTPAA
uniref:LisH domain-containing protein n=1 Tax=Canis lupus familiaris TaxID=9615 RepID=A0A8I3RR41_CANLF